MILNRIRPLLVTLLFNLFLVGFSYSQDCILDSGLRNQVALNTVIVHISLPEKCYKIDGDYADLWILGFQGDGVTRVTLFHWVSRSLRSKGNKNKMLALETRKAEIVDKGDYYLFKYFDKNQKLLLHYFSNQKEDSVWDVGCSDIDAYCFVRFFDSESTIELSAHVALGSGGVPALIENFKQLTNQLIVN